MARHKSIYKVFYDHDYWFQVTIDELERLGIADKISNYSLRRGKTVYLEETDDAGLFLRTKCEQEGFADCWWDDHDTREEQPAGKLIHLVKVRGRDFSWPKRSKYPYYYHAPNLTSNPKEGEPLWLSLT